MAGEAQDDVWPVPKFYFRVKFGEQAITGSFQEVSGLEAPNLETEYRHGDSNQFSNNRKPGNITLKKGFLGKDNFLQWYEVTKLNTLRKETVTIQLIDEKGNAAMTWTLLNAWPTRISGPDLNSNTNEILIEVLELAHEGLLSIKE